MTRDFVDASPGDFVPGMSFDQYVSQVEVYWSESKGGFQPLSSMHPNHATAAAKKLVRVHGVLAQGSPLVDALLGLSAGAKEPGTYEEDDPF